MIYLLLIIHWWWALAWDRIGFDLCSVATDCDLISKPTKCKSYSYAQAGQLDLQPGCHLNTSICSVESEFESESKSLTESQLHEWAYAQLG